MNSVLGRVYSLDLASPLPTIISRRAHQGSFPGHLLRKKPIPLHPTPFNGSHCQALLVSLPNLIQ